MPKSVQAKKIVVDFWLDQSAVFQAAGLGHVEVARILVTWAKDRRLFRFGCGRTPLQVAAEHWHLALVKMLLKTEGDNEKNLNNTGACLGFRV
jgi:ankyrin repeat protein